MYISTERTTARWLSALGLAALLMALGVLPASAQTLGDGLRYSLRSPAVGARTLGFAGAGIGGVADYSALFVNPAGLSLAPASEVVGSFAGLQADNLGRYRLGGFENETDFSVRTSGLGGLGYLYKAPTAQGSLVIGASYNRTYLYDRELDFEGRNDLNSVTDFFLPVNQVTQEFQVTQIDPSSSDETFFGQFIVEDDAGNAYLVDFDPDGDGFINRPLSYIAFETFGIDFAPALFDDGDPSPFLPAVTAGTLTQAGRVSEWGGTNEISLGGSAEALQGTHIGVSANFVFGSYNLEQVFEEIDDQNFNDGFEGTTDFDRLTLTDRLETDLTGVNLRLGLVTTALPNLRVGLTLETPTFYNITEQYSTELETFFDNGDLFVYGDEASEDVGSGEFEYEIRTPWRLGLGGALTLGNLTVLGDAELVDWSQLEFSADTDELFFEDLSREARDELDVVVNTRLGAEFALGGLMLRAGVAYQPDPRGELELADGGTLNRDRSFFSLGLGYRLSEELRVDLGWMQERVDGQYQPYAEVQGAPIVSEELTRDRFALGVSYRF